MLTRDGWDPAKSPPQKGNCGNAGCVVAWGPGTRSVASVVLIANGICFAVMTVIFVILGSVADYGAFGRWMLLFLTVVCWISQYGMTAIREPSQWPTAMVLYIVSYISYVSPYKHIKKLRLNENREQLWCFTRLCSQDLLVSCHMFSEHETKI